MDLAESLKRKESYESLYQYCKKLEAHVLRLEEDLEKERKLRLQSELKIQDLIKSSVKREFEGAESFDDSEMIGFVQKVVDLSNQLNQAGNAILNERRSGLFGSNSSIFEYPKSNFDQSILSRSLEESSSSSVFLRKSHSPELNEDSVLLHIQPIKSASLRNSSPNFQVAQSAKISPESLSYSLRNSNSRSPSTSSEDSMSLLRRNSQVFQKTVSAPCLKPNPKKNTAKSHFLLCDVSREITLSGMNECIKEKFNIDESEFSLEFGEGGPGAGRVAFISVVDQHAEKFNSLKRFRAIVDGVKMRMKVTPVPLESLEQYRSKISEEDNIIL